MWASVNRSLTHFSWKTNPLPRACASYQMPASSPVALIVFEPARWYRHRTVAGETGVNGCHIRFGNGPAQRPQVLFHLRRLAAAHQGHTDDGITCGPA